jgi:hypothetical protein
MKWSWLQNPAVNLIGLLASVIAVIQWVASVCRYVHRLQTEAENEKYRRVRLAVALTALVVVAVFSVVTWPVLIAEAAKAGDRGFMGVLDVLEFALMGIVAAQGLLKEARTRQPFSVFASVLLFVTLTSVAVGYIFSSGSTAWIGTSLTASSTNLGIVVVACLAFRYARKIKPEQTTAQ